MEGIEGKLLQSLLSVLIEVTLQEKYVTFIIYFKKYYLITVYSCSDVLRVNIQSINDSDSVPCISI